MTDFNCPYCNIPFEVCRDDGHGCEEDITYQDECWSCGKTFVFTAIIDISYKARKADCLNDGDHDWRFVKTYPLPLTRMRCWICDQERQLTDEEKDGLMTRYLFSVAEPKPNTRFKAFFYDDSGSSVFYRDADGNYWFGDMSEPTHQDKDWFFEAGYIDWEYVT